MTQEISVRAGGSRSVSQRVLLLVWVFILAVVLWNVIGVLAGILIFAMAVYIVYLMILRRYF